MSNPNESLPALPNRIVPEERAQIARETNRLHLPREIQKWIQSLDLSYKIKDITKDLANGFSIAEILSRYPVPFLVNQDSKVDHEPLKTRKVYVVNMKEFSNGTGFKERTTNWNHIAKILRQIYGFPITNDTCERIINKAPNAAFDFLCVLYKQLTKREPYILNKTDETDKFRNYAEVDALPKYMRPTASRLVQNSEVQRIKDDLIRKYKVSQIIEEQKNYIAKERELFMQQEAYEKEQEKLRKIRNKAMQMSKNASKNANAYQSGAQAESQINNLGIPENEKEDDNLNANDMKEEKINLLGQLLELNSLNKEGESVEREFQQLIQQYFLDEDRNFRVQLNMSADKNIINFFFAQNEAWKNEMIDRLLLGYQEKSKDIAGIISRDLVELIPFINIICKLLDHLAKKGYSWDNLSRTSLEICKIVNNKGINEKCDNIFINFSLDTVLDMIKLNPIYRNEMCNIIFSLIMNNYSSFNNLIKKVSKKFANSDELIYYHIMTQILTIMCNWAESKEYVQGENEKIFFDAIKKGLCSTCDLIKIKSLYMAVTIITHGPVPLKGIIFFDSIQNLKGSNNWEILGLILIYCSTMLLRVKEEREKQKEEYEKQPMVNPNEMLEEEAQLEEEHEEIKEENQENMSKSNIKDKSQSVNKSQNKSQMQSNVSNPPQENQENVEGNQEEIMQIPQGVEGEEEGEEMSPEELREEQLYREYLENLLLETEKKEESFVQMINDIFKLNSPFMTIKVGFIYLASILKYYPKLAKDYMKLLIEYKDKTIRKEVLEVPKDRNQGNDEEEEEKEEDEEEEKEDNEEEMKAEEEEQEYCDIPKEYYTGNVYTEKYKINGAPKLWNQLEIAKIFRDYIIEKKSERFEGSHIFILKSIIKTQKIDENDSNWITLYNDLKEFIFLALSDSNDTDVAYTICKELFKYNSLLPKFLETTKDLFNNTMKMIYEQGSYRDSQKGMDEKERTKANLQKNNPSLNMKRLLTFISRKNKRFTKIDCKDYVYNLIKKFAIQNDKLYLQSNLLDLMNRIYNKKRG
ncbi:MAG: calponin homology domain-containing protein [archaeon]|nr:calponin homology domain-containing protein [archaeon]